MEILCTYVGFPTVRQYHLPTLLSPSISYSAYPITDFVRTYFFTWICLMAGGHSKQFTLKCDTENVTITYLTCFVSTCFCDKDKNNMWSFLCSILSSSRFNFSCRLLVLTCLCDKCKNIILLSSYLVPDELLLPPTPQYSLSFTSSARKFVSSRILCVVIEDDSRI